jgi:hypothetical protein
MDVGKFILEVFKNSKKPTELNGISPIKKLNEIHDFVTLYFVDRKAETVSALYIDEYFPINDEMVGIIKGEWDLGLYNHAQEEYFSMGKHPITRLQFRPELLTQNRLNESEVYIKNHLEGLL